MKNRQVYFNYLTLKGLDGDLTRSKQQAKPPKQMHIFIFFIYKSINKSTRIR